MQMDEQERTLLFEQIATVTRDTMHEYMGIDGEQHKQDHKDLRAYLDGISEDRRERRRFFDKLKVAVIAALVVGSIGTFGTAMWYAFNLHVATMKALDKSR